MLFKEEPNSKIWAAENALFLPNSVMDEVFINQLTKLPPLEQVIYKIGSLPAIVQLEYIKKGINLDQQDLKLLSIFQKQYRDISKSLRVLAFPQNEAEVKAKTELEKSESNLVKPFADYYWTMLKVLKICLKKRQIGNNSSPNLPYLLWYDMVSSHFVESLENSGFLKPFSNNDLKSKREITDRWRDDIEDRLDLANGGAIKKDNSKFCSIGDNSELFEQKGHKIFFDDSLRWAKENLNYKVIYAVRDLFNQEKKLVHTITKGENCGMYQFLNAEDDKLYVTGRKQPKGFGSLSTSKRKKSKGQKK